MYNGSIVSKKTVSGPINWNSFNENFPQATPIPFLEAVELVKAKQRVIPETVVVGKVYRRWPFYHDITGGCGNGNASRRIRFLLSDVLANDNHCFYVTCWGQCAEELESLGLQENFFIQIWKPYITVKRWQPREKQKSIDMFDKRIYDYEIWFGIEDGDINVNYEKQFVIYNVEKEQTTKVVTPITEEQTVTVEQVTDEPPVKQPKLVNEQTIDKLTFQEIAKTRLKNFSKSESEVQEYDNYIYSVLKECVSREKSVKYNVYAIVTNVRREPTPCRTNKLMSQVYITDPSCEGTYGFSDFQFSLLGHKIEDFPEIIYGSIIRIHHMSIQMYQGFLNGRVFDARSVTVVGHREKDTNEKELSLLNKRDKTKVDELRIWWAKEGKEKNSQSLDVTNTENLLEFRNVTSSTTVFNIKCTVIEKISTKMTRCKILRVSDKTKSKLPMVYQDKDGITLKSKVDSDVHDIFVEEHLELLQLAKPGKMIMLNGLQCVPMTLNSSPETSYKLVINSEVKTNCSTVSKQKQNAQDPEHSSFQDSEFDKMFANAIKLPSTEEESICEVSNKDLEAENLNAKEMVNDENVPFCSKDSNPEKTDESEEFSIPTFPVNTGPLIVQPCESTDESMSTDKNENSDSHSLKLNAPPKINEIVSTRELEIMERFNNPCMTTDVSFEALIQLEKSICGSAQICRESSDDNSPHKKTNFPDSMHVFAGSQEPADALENSVSFDLNNESGGLAPTVRSPSPSSKRTFATRSSGNYELISSTSDATSKTASEKFRIVGFVKRVQPNILRSRNNLILMHSICKDCCKSIPLLKLEQFKDPCQNATQTPACSNCNEKMELYLCLKLDISDFEFSQPLQLSDTSQDGECELILSGVHAEYFFGISAHNFFFEKEVQDKVVTHLTNLVGKRVELSVVVIEESSKREYHIIDSYMNDNDDE